MVGGVREGGSGRSSRERARVRRGVPNRKRTKKKEKLFERYEAD